MKYECLGSIHVGPYHFDFVYKTPAPNSKPLFFRFVLQKGLIIKKLLIHKNLPFSEEKEQ
jgi:hypothetical protein